jgi:ABC-type lipoprotein export system ATPase subunit
MPPPILEVHSVSKSYADRAILREVSFVMSKGERVALLGPSGSGKTTLLNCIGGVDHPDGGQVLIGGVVLGDLDGDGLAALRRRSLGSVFQFFHLLPTMTAFENIELPLQLLGQPQAKRKQRVQGLLERVGIAHRSDALPAQLSGGEMQRVAIARAIAHEPALILADEPTGNLDTKTGAVVLELLREMTEETGAALLMVTHSEAAAAVCHRVLRMIDGEVVSDTLAQA